MLPVSPDSDALSAREAVFPFELKNFPAGNLISSTGFSIALQARAKRAEWLPELFRVYLKPKLIQERVLVAETFNQEEQAMNAQNLTKSRQTKSGSRDGVW